MKHFNLNPYNIIKMGNSILRQKSKKVTNIFDPKVQEIIQRMEDTITMIQNNSSEDRCVGLAAPQVAIPLRIFFFRESRETNMEIVINPSFKALSNKTEKEWEGCYSMPKLFALVDRYTKIECSYETPQGEKTKRTLQGFSARVFQHELDHLDGILTIDRVNNIKEDFIFEDEKIDD